MKRTMGTGLGGFPAGWFRLRSGEKALVHLTDRRRVLYLPTTEDCSVLPSSRGAGAAPRGAEEPETRPMTPARDRERRRRG